MKRHKFYISARSRYIIYLYTICICILRAGVDKICYTFDSLIISFSCGDGEFSILSIQEWLCIGSTPHPVTVANEGLVWDSLLKA